MSQTYTVTVTGTDVIYVSRQIRLDLREIRKVYPHLIDESGHDRIYDAIEKFLYEQAVSKIGFSIYEPDKDNLVYHEWTYIVLLGDAIPENLRGKEGQGKGGKPIIPVSKLPRSARFTAWVNWSQSFLNLPVEEQKSIIEGTGWSLPYENTFKGKYEDSGNLTKNGYYASGQIGVEIRTYRKDI